MALFSDLYADIANDFKEWLRTGNVGDFVTDIALRYLNRAQKSLNKYRPWKGAILKYQSLSLTNKVGTYPAACAKLWRVYEDSDGDGKPDKFYYENTARTNDGYIIKSTFAKATGRAKTITFFASPGSTIYLDYSQILTDFTGSGTEYSFFDGETLLKKAQLLYLEQDGRIGTDEYKMILNSLHNDLVDLIQNEAENLDMRTEVKDSEGRLVATETYSLADGAGSQNPERYEPDVDI